MYFRVIEKIMNQAPNHDVTNNSGKSYVYMDSEQGSKTCSMLSELNQWLPSKDKNIIQKIQDEKIVYSINDAYVVKYKDNWDKEPDFKATLGNKKILKFEEYDSTWDLVTLTENEKFKKFLKHARNIFIICANVSDESGENLKNVKYCLNNLAIQLNSDILIMGLNNIYYVKSKIGGLVITKIFETIFDSCDISNSKLDLNFFENNDNFYNIIEIINLFTKEEIEKYKIIAYLIQSKKFDINRLNLKQIELEVISQFIELSQEKTLYDQLCFQIRPADQKNEEHKEQIEEFVKKITDFGKEVESSHVNDILGVIEKNDEIVLDFQNDSIENAFPVATKDDKGIYDSNKKKIVVGALNKEQEEDKRIARLWEILGILIHESCHLAMKKVFKNNGKPYYEKNDTQNQNDYEKILDSIKVIGEKNDEIIRRVFVKGNYDQNKELAELIVRVPQMIIVYGMLNPSHLKNLRTGLYKGLFNYFFDIVVPKVIEYSKLENKWKREVTKVSTIDKFIFHLKHPKAIIFDPKKSFHFIKSNNPMLTMSKFAEKFSLRNSSIFTKMSDLIEKCDSKSKYIWSLWKSNALMPMVILCDLSYAEFKHQSYKFYENRHKFIIFNETYSEWPNKLMTIDDYENLPHETFNYFDLEEVSQKKVLDAIVNFQGTEMKLSEIFTDLFPDKVLSTIPINHIIEKKATLNFVKPILKNEEYTDDLFIHRKIIGNGNKIVVNTNILDKIFNLLSNNKYLIFIGEPGIGKSSVVTFLASNLQTHKDGPFLVIKIKLREQIETMVKFNHDTELDDFVFDNFVKFSEFTEFEREIFNNYYYNKKIILLIDGFDEILPNYEKQIANLIKKALHSEKIKNLIVATRISDNRINNNEALELTLEPLTEKNQIKYLKKYFKHKQEGKKQKRTNFSEDKLEKISEKSVKVMSRIPNMLSFPLHLLMYAEYISDSIFKFNNDEEVLRTIESINLYDLYGKFIENKKDIAREGKGPNVKDNIRKNEPTAEGEGLNFYDCARKLALKNFEDEFGIKMELTKEEMDFLLNYGIVRKMGEKNIAFVHFSFAEFLIAGLFIFEIKKTEFLKFKYVNEKFFMEILFDSLHDNVRNFINQWLSKDDNLDKIPTELLNGLGEIILKSISSITYCDIYFHEINKNLLQLIKKSIKNIEFSALIYKNISIPKEFSNLSSFYFLYVDKNIFSSLFGKYLNATENEISETRKKFYSLLKKSLSDNSDPIDFEKMQDYFNNFQPFFDSIGNIEWKDYNFLFFATILEENDYLQMMKGLHFCSFPTFNNPILIFDILIKKITDINLLFQFTDKLGLVHTTSLWEKNEFSKLFEEFQKIFSKQQVESLLFCEEKGWKVSFKFSKVSKQVIDFFSEKFERKNSCETLLNKRCEDYNWNIFDILFHYNHLTSVKKLLEIAKEELDEQNFNHLLLDINKKYIHFVMKYIEKYKEDNPKESTFSEILAEEFRERQENAIKEKDEEKLCISQRKLEMIIKLNEDSSDSES